jgi:Family of unknown function (DUF5994)
MSVSMVHADAASAGPPTMRGLRLRLKPGRRPGGLVQGAWWPRSTQLATELRDLLDVLASRSGPIDRVIYDENVWASTPLRIEVRGHSVILEPSRDQSINTLSVIGQQFGKLVLLVVPPYTKPTRAYTAVMTASKPEDCSSADELLGIGAREVEDRRLALIAQQRWESEGGALRRGLDPGPPVLTAPGRQVHRAQ